MPQQLINVDEIRHRIVKLQEEIQQLENMLSLANYLDREQARFSGGILKLETQPAIQPEKKGRGPYRQGAQRALLIALMQGSAKIEDLTRSLSWDAKKVSLVVNHAIHAGFVAPFGTDRVELTARGKQVAEWFTKHPGYVVYRPNGFNFEVKS